MAKRDLTLIDSENYNTNNAWGFGGSVGTYMTYSNMLVIQQGKYCYRHAPSVPFTKYLYNSEHGLFEIIRLSDIMDIETNLYEIEFAEENRCKMYVSAENENMVKYYINNPQKFITHYSREIKNISEIKL